MNLSQGDAEEKQLNTYVVSACVTNATGTIQNLKEYVAVTLHHLKAKTVSRAVRCHDLNAGRNIQTVSDFNSMTRMCSVFTGISVRMVGHTLNYIINMIYSTLSAVSHKHVVLDGYGGWNPNGCWTYNVSKDYTTCLCDHLTHFGVLLVCWDCV